MRKVDNGLLCRGLTDGLSRCERLDRDTVLTLVAVMHDESRPAAERDAARNRLVESVLPLLVAIAIERAVRHHLDVDDLISFGTLQLIAHIVPAFDPSRGVKLGTYVGKSLNMEILNYIEEWTHAVHIPRYIANYVRRYLRLVPPVPTPHEYADSLPGLTAKVRRGIVAALEGRAPAVAVAYHWGEPGYEVPVEPESSDPEEARESVGIGLTALDKRETAVIRRHFGLVDRGRVYYEDMANIGKRLRPPLCRERVRQIKEIALAKMGRAICQASRM